MQHVGDPTGPRRPPPQIQKDAEKQFTQEPLPDDFTSRLQTQGSNVKFLDKKNCAHWRIALFGHQRAVAGAIWYPRIYGNIRLLQNYIYELRILSKSSARDVDLIHSFNVAMLNNPDMSAAIAMALGFGVPYSVRSNPKHVRVLRTTTSKKLDRKAMMCCNWRISHYPNGLSSQCHHCNPCHIFPHLCSLLRPLASLQEHTNRFPAQSIMDKHTEPPSKS